MIYRQSLLLLWLLLASLPVQAGRVFTDDTGRQIRLDQPARRIVALAPHIAENVYAAGAGDRLVGTVDYSDYPPEARRVPRVGGYSRIDMEAILALKPDLVLAWETGNNLAQIDRLRALGVTVYLSQPNRVADIAGQLERIGELAGSEPAARQAASRFRERLAELQRQSAGKAPVRVFYQIWKEPLMTVGGPQIISDSIRLCGGENVFGHLTQMAPRVSLESVIQQDPEVIVATGMGEAEPAWLRDWTRWPQLRAVRQDNLFHIHPDIMQRHTPRILDGAATLCRQLDTARSRRGAKIPLGTQGSR